VDIFSRPKAFKFVRSMELGINSDGLHFSDLYQKTFVSYSEISDYKIIYNRECVKSILLETVYGKLTIANYENMENLNNILTSLYTKNMESQS
jgi:hypothetical protein